MNNQIIIEGNELIANFMDFKSKCKINYFKIPNKIWFGANSSESYVLHHSSNLLFHLSWDWLKPVIDKIGTFSLAYPEQTENLRRMKILVNIEPCWEECVQFIKWYNNHTKLNFASK